MLSNYVFHMAFKLILINVSNEFCVDEYESGVQNYLKDFYILYLPCLHFTLLLVFKNLVTTTLYVRVVLHIYNLVSASTSSKINYKGNNHKTDMVGLLSL